jgi:hypothetical protein
MYSVIETFFYILHKRASLGRSLSVPEQDSGIRDQAQGKTGPLGSRLETGPLQNYFGHSLQSGNNFS